MYKLSPINENSNLNHSFANLNGIKLHYVSAGDGELILFLHGFPEFWYEWKNQISEFSKDYFVVCPDMRGYNLSTKPKEIEQYKIECLVEDIKYLVEYLGYKKFILVGHDWGGSVAWEFAINHPEYVLKLVIINSPHPIIYIRELFSNPAQRKASQYSSVFQSPDAEQILSRNNYKIIFNLILMEVIEARLFTEEDKKSYIQAWSQPGALTGGLNYYRALNIWSLNTKELHENLIGIELSDYRIKVPTLVIWGEKDTSLLTGNLNGLSEFVSNLTVKLIPDGSHWVIHEKPDIINSYIYKFIE